MVTRAGQFQAHWQQEWRNIWQDSWLRLLVTLLPLLLFGWMVWLFDGGQVRELPLGVVDQDHSHFSRALARQLDGASGLALTATYPDLQAGSRAMRQGQIYGLLFIPKDAEKGVRQGTQPVVSLFYNSQLLLVGKLINGAAQQSLGGVNIQLAALGALPQAQALPSALGVAMPLASQLTPLYNGSGNYALFLVSALLPAVWQILIVVTVISSFVRRARNGQEATWHASGFWAGLGALLPYQLLFWGWGGVMGALLFGYRHWPMVGSWSLLLLGQGLTVLACLGLGSLLYLLTRDGARAFSLAAVLTAPGFAFMGVTFPASQMGELAQLWRALLPVSHYAELQLGQASLGLVGQAAWQPVLALLGFVPLWLLVAGLQGRRSHG